MAFGLVIAAVLAFASPTPRSTGTSSGRCSRSPRSRSSRRRRHRRASRRALARPRRRGARRRPELVFWSGAVSDVVSANAYPTLTMSLLAALVAGALMPWGLWPQVVAARR
jgi:hypothetical protein